MIREYKTIEEISGPLMVVKKVQNVTYDELAEIELYSHNSGLLTNWHKGTRPVYVHHFTSFFKKE